MSDLHGLAGLYALDALDELDRRRFEQHLESCDDCRQEVAGFRDTASTLADAEQRTPPPALRADVLTAVGRTRQERPVPAARRVRRLAPWLAVAAAVLVALILGAGLLDARSDADRLREVAAVLAAPDAVVVPLEGPAATSARFVSSADAGAGGGPGARRLRGRARRGARPAAHGAWRLTARRLHRAECASADRARHHDLARGCG